MPTHNGNPIFRPASGANAGRGDNAHYLHDYAHMSDSGNIPAGRTAESTAQQAADQHTIAHADGFIGPRIGETYSDGRTPSRTVLTTGGGRQRDPGYGYIYHKPGSGMTGTADRAAHLDSVTQGEARMYQHRETGNIVETLPDGRGGRQVNKFGTAASGVGMEPNRDLSMSYVNTIGFPDGKDEYTDITETVRGTDSYKKARG